MIVDKGVCVSVRATKKIGKWYALVGITLTAVLAMAMFLGAWVAEAAPVTPTVAVTPTLEFSVPTTAAVSVAAGASNTAILAVSAKSNATWTVTISPTTPLTSTAVPGDAVPASMFKLTTAGATTTYNAAFPSIATVVLGAARGSYTATFTYTVDLTSGAGWDVVPHTDYTCAHTYTASN